MKTILASLLFAVACCAAPPPVAAQAASAAAAAAASAPAGARPKPRVLSPAEQRDSATIPGDVRPVDAVVPQISVPLGRTPPAPAKTQAEVQRQRRTEAAGGVDDAVARCKAQTTRAARAECMDRLGRRRAAP